MPEPATRPFDLMEAIPERGTFVIEASAGTGKTYNIQHLYLRLLVERGLKADELLVVTFTEAATAELRGRIRTNLATAAELLEREDVDWGAGAPPGGADLNLFRILARARAGHDTVELHRRLRLALISFDESAIFTIHGFCNRMLADNAFESASLFDLDLLEDSGAILQEVVDDFWRRHAYRDDPLAQVEDVDVKSLTEMARQFSRKPEAALEPPAPRSGNAADGDAAAGGDARRLELVFRLHDYVLTEFRRRKREGRFITYDDMLYNMRDALIVDGRLDPDCPLATAMQRQFKAVLIDEFQDTDPVQYQIFDTAFGAGRALVYLIGDPKQSIYGFRGADIFAYIQAAGAAARRTLTANYRSEPALLKAFDQLFEAGTTNPFAYREIPYLPMQAGQPPKEELVIDDDSTPAAGDGAARGPRPGAALQLWWMEQEGGQGLAKDAAEERVRSATASEIVRLLTLADRGQARFITRDDEGQVRDARPLAASDIAVLVLENRQATDMQRELARRRVPSVIHNSGSLFASPEAMELYYVLRAVAEPQNETYLRTALAGALLAVPPADLALLDTDEGADLHEYWVECLREHQELWARRGFMRMFMQLLQPTHPETRRTAAGRTVPTRRGRRFRRLAKTHGSVHKNLRSNILQRVEGERALTNVLHLGEVLHQAAAQFRLGQGGLIAWLARRIANAEEEAAEHELRLERDDAAVRIVTIHKSKGLEYPVVFSPFNWSKGWHRSGERAREPYLFHREVDGRPGAFEAVLAVSPEAIEAFEALRAREALSESLRLLYVSVTRARNRCYLAGGDIGKRGVSDSPLTYLFRGGCEPDPDAMAHLLDTTPRRLDWLAFGERAAAWDASAVVNRSEPPDERDDRLRRPQAARPLACRPFRRTVPCDFGVMSFSSLGRHAQSDDRNLGDDPGFAPGAVEADEGPVLPFAEFPRGNLTGTCVHEILEELDFSAARAAPRDGWLNARPDMRRLIERKLRQYGRIAPAPTAAGGERAMDQAVGAVADMLHRVLNLPLPAQADGNSAVFQLSDPQLQRAAELDFYYPVYAAIDTAALQTLLRRSGGAPADAESLLEDLAVRFRNPHGARRGFMYGLIDLVVESGGRYYFLDWKTTTLGRRQSAYRRPAIVRNMIETAYILQFHIYSLALHLLLARRLGSAYDFNRHFGGGFYLYVRGVDGKDCETGVYCDRQDLGRMNELARVFHVTPGGAS